MNRFPTETGVIAYRLLEAEEGGADAPTLTLVHNFMSTGRAAWGALLPVLNRRHRILLPDLPGHGESIGFPPGFHHWAIARQLAALIRSVGADLGHLAGCSSGGMIAQLLVHHGMVQPSTLILVSTTHSTNPATTGSVAPLRPEDFQAGRNWLEATARLHDPWQGPDYYANVLLPGFRGLDNNSSIDLPVDALRAFAMPALIVHGAHDEFFPVEIPQAMAQALPDAELHVIPGQTHALIFRQPWKVAEIMEHFLARHTDRAESAARSV